MATLRSDRGCPWDRRQTHATLRPFLIEEAYELIDAIDRRDLDALPGELGDVLFQCVFHAQLGAERGRFDIVDAIEAISAKLIRRHPHVFTPNGRALPRRPRRAAGGVKTPAAVITQWEAIKAAEQRTAGRRQRLLSGVPRALPALVRAHEIGTRVAAVGFDWTTADAVTRKLGEELRELAAARRAGRRQAIEEELGDVLFTVVNLARKLGLDAEAALRRANDKFSRRFESVEARLERRGRSVHAASPRELNAEWARVKRRR